MPEDYKFGHSSSTTASHASRTVHSDAAFLLPYIKSTDRILDVGCGPGSITYGFAEYVPEGSVTGTDYAPEVIQRAQSHVVSKISQDDGKSRGKVEFVVGNVLERLPFEDETFDIVFSSQVLTHLGDASVKALNEMRRVLKVGGILSSRDGAMLHYHPAELNVDKYWDIICRVVGIPGFSGPKMAAFYRAVGFDVDGGKVIVGTGSNCVTGKAAVKTQAENMCGRLKKGDAFRAGWEKAGISEEEIEECAKNMRIWGDTEDAWYGILQSEIVAWK